MTEGRVGRRFVDVSGLPTYVQGHRDPLWWGLWALVCVEATMFALLVASYLYLRGNESEWPPTGAVQPPLALTASTLVVLLLSAIPMWIAFRAAADHRLRPIQISMIFVTLLSAIAAVTRGYEFAKFGYWWHSHAYGSIVWAIYFMHSFHLLSGVVENAIFTALVFRGPVEKKHMLDLRLSSYYWWFVVFTWLPLWGLIMGDAFFFGSTR
ncbi:MAG TPA: cytochrome c oxidase subunit 3 [Thermoanaerobaculia bacterium]|nr:cytochrome c oxidase subunit 3 [Thermoanaerobaculia bacterium]